MKLEETREVQEDREARRWRIFEVFFFVMVLLHPVVVGGAVFFSNDARFFDMADRQKMSCLTAATTYSLLAWAMRVCCARFAALGTNQIRDAILLPIMLWMVVLAYAIMPQGEFNASQRAIVSLWGTAPFGIFIGWCWGFAAAQEKNLRPHLNRASR